ncbi:small GTPase superfamily, partial [Chlamydoabsidia padenii]
IGESGVGKTSFLHRFVNADFTDNREPTVGAGFLTKTYKVDDRMLKLNCWDTAGQERFHSLAPMYYRGAQAAVVIFDVTKQATFAKAKSWIHELQRQAPPHIVIALVGNKIDLCESQQESTDEDNEHQDRQVTTEEASQYAAETGALFFETSARLNLNVDKVFTEIGNIHPHPHTQIYK